MFKNSSVSQARKPSRLEAIATRVEAIASRLGAIATRVEAIASRLEAIATRVEAIANRLEAIATIGWRPSLLGWSSLVGGHRY